MKYGCKVPHSLRVLLFCVLLLSMDVRSMFAQTSNSVTVTVQAVPAALVISVAPLNYYQGMATSLTVTVGSGGVSSSCTGTWDTSALTLTFTAASGSTPAKFTAPVTAVMTASLGSHAILITCPLPVLSLNSPVTLPNFQLGQQYTADLASLTAVKGGTAPYTFSLSSGSLPTGLTLSAGGAVTGTPSGAGCFKCSFGFTVMDSSGTVQLKGAILNASSGPVTSAASGK